VYILESAEFSNPIKHRLLKGEKMCGCWIQLASNIATEIIADSGYNILLFDCEHAPIEISTLIQHFQAMRGSGAMSMVRVPWNDLVLIKRVLDCGAQAIHIPYVNTYEEAVAAVRACKYPPIGDRGIAGAPRANYYGDSSHKYREKANDEILVVVAIETLQGVSEVDKMLTIEGLDGIFIGPLDLSTNMGYFCNPQHPVVQAKIKEIEEKVKHSNKLLATISSTPEKAIELYNRGYNYIIIGSDERYVRQGATKDVQTILNYKNTIKAI
jgi:2-keto-3-deoxy-L-rhamnonate aldolase RhmA